MGALKLGMSIGMFTISAITTVWHGIRQAKKEEELWMKCHIAEVNKDAFELRCLNALEDAGYSYDEALKILGIEQES